MKPREFWIKKGFLDPKEGVVRLTKPTDYSTEYFEHIIRVVPLDWLKIRAAYFIWGGAMGGDEKAIDKIQQLVEKQLRGE